MFGRSQNSTKRQQTNIINITNTMRKIIAIIVALAITATAFAKDEKRVEWILRKASAKNKAATEFLETGIYPATIGNGALSFVHKKRVTKCAINEKGSPYAESVKGDYWLFEMEAKDIEAGTVVDFWTQINSEPEKESHRFAIEYLDGKRWVPVRPLDSDGSNYATTTSNKHPNRFWNAVTLSKAPKNGKISFRVRQVEDKPLKVTVYGPSTRGQLNQIIRYDKVEVRDTLNYLFIGNSYTYYHTYPMIFKEMAWHEGHYANCNIFISGGYTMKAHLANKYSREAVAKGGYDYAFLQDQSILPTLIGTEDEAGSVENMQKMVDNILKYNPNAKPIIEITWGRKHGNNAFGKYKHLLEKYPHFYTDYQTMQARLIEVTTIEAETVGAGLSPVGVAWQIVRRERPEIELYAKDEYHQSYAGSYLSAAVAYQIIYRTPFGEKATNAKLDAETAAYLRSVAERVVLHNEK